MANKNNKYKVYRKYTTDDNGISWVETDEYRIVLVEENSKDCIAETPTNTRWVETTGYICASKNKYAKEIKQISTDGWKTWTDTGEYRQGRLIEENSKDCGYTEVQYRWVVVNDPTKYVCVGTEKHKMEIRQLSNDGGITWVNVSPEETRASDEIIELNSLDCGGTVIYYKWVDTGFECGSNLSSDSIIVDEAPGELTKETIYRWVVAQGADDYICDNGVKYYLYVKEKSTDGGLTWSEVQPREIQKGTIMENKSYDCIPECKTKVKYTDGSTNEFYINGKITRSSIKNITDVTNINVGTCVTSIGSYIFTKCNKLKSITLPNSVEEIGKGAFEYCSSLTSITIPNSVKEIESGAFEGCSSLTSIKIPDSVKVIEQSAFKDCSSLSSITIPTSVSIIHLDTFRKSGIKSIKIPDSVKEIESGAFEYCRNLTSITIPNSLTDIGASAFQYCTSLNEIVYKGTISQWNSIKKGNSWYFSVPAKVVNCTDGDVAIE